MKIIVNGAPREIAENATLADLLEEYRQKKAIVVGEINGRIPENEQCTLHEGDRVEIVTFVGGGCS